MNVGWLLDAEMFPHYRDELVETIRAQGHDVKLVEAPSPPFRWDDVGCSYRDTFAADRCVVAHGDIALVTKISQEQRWKPGAFATVAHYFCSCYAVHFGEYWINRDYVMLPFAELGRRREFLFQTLGKEGTLFVRPDSPLKLFTGQTVCQASFQKDLEYMAFYEFPDESLVVVSSPKRIRREWRYIVVHDQVVTGCLYATDGEFESQATSNDDAEQLATRIASIGYRPDPVWVIDICETDDGNFHLLEIGGFSFADWYACDKALIVDAVSNAAIEIWKTNQ